MTDEFDLSQVTPVDVTDSPLLDSTVTPDHDLSRDASDKPAKAVRSLGQNRKPRPTIRRTKPGELTQPITQFYVLLGLGIAPFAPFTSATIGNNAEQCAQAWDKLAQENDAVRRVLLAMIETGAWAGLVAAHTPIAIAVMMETGRMPERFAAAASTLIGSDNEST